MPARKGLLAPQNNFLDTIATRFDGTHSNFVLGNAQVPTIYPIVYCSDGFCELTGFSRAFIMQKGCACEFLYGKETTEEQKKKIQQALQDKTELKLEVKFYKKTKVGTLVPFWCLLDIVPIKNEKHEVVLFLASHKDITKSKLAEQSDDASSGKSGLDGSSGSDEEPDDEEDEEESDAKKVNNQYHRRRSRAVLYQLSGHYRKSVSMKGKLKNNLLHSSSLPEYKAQNVKKPFFIISHYGNFKTFWDWFILVATFYVGIAVPYSVTFRDNSTQDTPITIYSDVLVEIVFIIDILINFKTTYVNKKGEVVTISKLIISHYLKGWFLCDMLAALPFDLLYALNLVTRNTLIHLLKLTRLVRLARLYSKMDRYSQYSYIILILLMLIFFLLSHWFACIWYIIAAQELFYHPEWEFGWIKQLSSRVGWDIHNSSDTASFYITALYFTTSSLTSVGFGNVSANTNFEKVFSVVVMLIGALMHAVVFGNVTAIIQRMYARRSQYQTKLRDLKDFFRLHQIPKQLKQRMIEFFQTTWSISHGIDTNEVLKGFPDELRGDVTLHMHREMLNLSIFATAPQGCLKLLSRHIRTIFSAPEEYLIHNGDALNYIYLVCNGSMEVLQNQMVVAILGKGDLVGCNIPDTLDSEALIKSSGDVKALTYCDLKSIQISGLLEVLRLYPEFAETFCNEIKHDLTFNLRDGYDEDEYDNGIGYGFDGHPLDHDDDEDDEEIDESNDEDRHDGPNDDRDGGTGAEQIQKDVEELDDEDILSDSNQVSKINKTNIKSDDQNDALMINRKISQSQDIVSTSVNEQPKIDRLLHKRCSLDKVGSASSLNENFLPNRCISSADRLEQLSIEPHLKYAHLRLVDDDTNEDEESDKDNSVASCPTGTIAQPIQNKSLLISKLKTNTKSGPSNRRSVMSESGESSPPDMQNRRKYLHFNTTTATTKQQDLPPAFRSRKTVGYNLLSGTQERQTDRYGRTTAAQYRMAANQMQPKKALRFSQQLNSSGSSAGSPIFNSFAERRRAQFTTFGSGNYTKSNIVQSGRRSSGASIHSMLYEQDSATAAAVQAVHETTTDSLERMDNQLHGLGDDVSKLSSDVRLSLYLLKQMCDLAAANLSQNHHQFSSKDQTSQSDQIDNQSETTDHNCNCNSKIIEKLKNISNNIELNTQLNLNQFSTSSQLANDSSGKQIGGILKHKKRSISSNSSQSLTDMLNEHRLLMNQQQQANQQRVKLNAKLVKCSSHSTLSLPIHNSPPSDLKTKFSAVHFNAKSSTIKEGNELKSTDQEQKSISTIKQSSLEETTTMTSDLSASDRQTPTLRNVRHSWNSLSQFIDSSTSSNEQAMIDNSKESQDFQKSIAVDNQGTEVLDLSAHLEQDISSTATSPFLTGQTVLYSQSNGNPPNLSCAIDIDSSDKESEKKI